MKRIISLVIAIIIAVSCIAQINGTIPRHSFDNSKYHARHPSTFSLQQNNLQTDRLQPDILKQKLDSIVSENWSPESNSWVKDLKNCYTYDAYGNVTTKITYHSTQNINDWNEESKIDYTFYDNAKPALIMGYQWDTTINIWLPYCKTEYTYDGNWDLILLLKSYPIGTTGLWLTLYKTEYYYDISRNLLGDVESIWNAGNNIWDFSNRSEYSYDENGDMTMQTKYYWDYINTEWVSSNKNELTYDNNGHVILEIESEWDENASAWLPLFKYEYTVDNNGNNTVEIKYEWSLPGMIWTESGKVEYTFDIDGGLKAETKYLWETTTTQWIINDKEVFTYTNAYTFSDLVLPYEFIDNTVYFKYMLNGMMYYSYVNTNFIPSYNEKYFYSVMNVIGINENESMKTRVYPNPSSDYIYFCWTDYKPNLDLSLMDISGRIIIQTNLKNKSSISLGHLSRGLYFYKLSDDNNTVSNEKISLQ